MNAYILRARSPTMNRGKASSICQPKRSATFRVWALKSISQFKTPRDTHLPGSLRQCSCRFFL